MCMQNKNTAAAIEKDKRRHLNIRASLVGDYIYNDQLSVIDVGSTDQGSRFMVPKNKAEAVVKAINGVLLND